MLSAFGLVIISATLYDLLTCPSQLQCDGTVNSAIANNDVDDRESLITDLRGPLYGTESDVPLIAVTPAFISRRRRVCSM